MTYKRITIRLTPPLIVEIKRHAHSHLRSFSKEIEFLLLQAVGFEHQNSADSQQNYHNIPEEDEDLRTYNDDGNPIR